MKVLLCFALFVALCVYSAEGLSCPVKTKGCTPEERAKFICIYGYTLDPCGGCTCAKGRGEVCGGPWGVEGNCATVLVCDKDETDFNASGKCVLRRRG